MAVGRGNTARTEDLVCPHCLPPLGQNSVKVKQELDGEASESKFGACPQRGWSWLRKTTSWDAQRQLGGAGQERIWALGWGKGEATGTHPPRGWPLAQVQAIIQCFCPAPQGAAVAVPRPSSSPAPDTLDNSHFLGGLSTSLCASVQVLSPLDHWPSFLCQGGRGG